MSKIRINTSSKRKKRTPRIYLSFSRTSAYIAGASTVFNIAGCRMSSANRLLGITDTATAIRSDWQCVSTDLNTALKKYAKKHSIVLKDF